MRAARLSAVLLAVTARADVERPRASAGGYFRIMARPDWQGGDGRLGFGNLYGRLMNEGPWAALELRLDLVPAEPARPTASLHAKIEGGSVAGASPDGGSLATFRLSQLYVLGGNLLVPRVTFRVGTLESYYGNLGLYDLRPADLLVGAVGVSGEYRGDRVDLLVGVGDSGFALRGTEYSAVLTAGAALRARASRRIEAGLGGQVMLEPEVSGSRASPHDTPGVDYEDWVRGEVAQRYVEENPGREEDFPRPVATSAFGWKGVAYLGFGGFGPLRWSSLFANLVRRMPDTRTTETYEDREYAIYVKSLTDERYEATVGNEMEMAIWSRRLDAVWAVLWGRRWDLDNDVAPSDADQTFASTVVRLQAYATETLHLLVETSLARERSQNGNRWREHADSVFENTGGMADSRGLEYGDADVRETVQMKGGPVLNPMGYGIFSRPSLRLLWGAQYSTQNLAFGHSFVESLAKYNAFGAAPERHWHQLLALEAEAWF